MAQAREDKWLGIHLSGPNADRTVIALCELRDGRPVLVQIIERIGSRANLSSDERIVEMIINSNSKPTIFVDVPLGLPPCLRCERSSCPSTIKCDDMSVAYMLSLDTGSKTKRRPFSPQSHRVWDVFSRNHNPHFEPSFSANLAPLALRGKILQKRLASLDREHLLMETNISMSLAAMATSLGIAKDKIKLYKSFEHGSTVRHLILKALVEKGLFEAGAFLQEKFVQSLDCFQAAICAWLNVQHHLGRLQSPPAHYLQDESWVWLPISKAVKEMPSGHH